MTPAPPVDHLPSAMKYLTYATGANMGFRREVFDALGGFDESYIGGHEEVSFAWRAHQLGFTIAFVLGASIDYRLRGELKSVLKQRFGYGRSYAQMYSKHYAEPITRTSIRHEVKFTAQSILAALSEVRSGHGSTWLCHAAWTAGRWYGGLRYRIRPPL